MPEDEDLDRYLNLTATLYGGTRERHARYNAFLFDGIDLSGCDMLDVGGGSGVLSYYAAVRGADRVVCLEPGKAGSNPRMETVFNGLTHGMPGLATAVDLVHETFQALDASDHVFDVVLVHSAINHLDEEACARLPNDAAARDTYIEMFTKLFNLTSPGGHLLVSDAARRNMWGSLGLTSPFAPTIEWNIHAQPSVWAELASAAGFNHPLTRWRAPHRLGRIGQTVLGNPIGSWLTNSMFILSMRRPSLAGL